MKKIRVMSFALLVAGFIGAPSFLSFGLDPRPECVRAAEWATAHAEALPSTLDDLEALPVGYRRAAFRHFTPAHATRLWLDNIDRVRRRGTWSSGQLMSLHSLTNALASGLLSAPDKHARILALAPTIRENFTRSQIIELTAMLGRPDPTYRSAQSIPLLFDNAARQVARYVNLQATQCDCSTQSDYCCGTFCSPTAPSTPHCIGGYHSCSSLPSGCGTFWTYQCDGQCAYE